MNFLELRYFVAVAEILNISKAAELLFISQQALSKHIRNLEQSLGTPLFKRSPRLTLTYMGERFLKTAREILLAKERIMLEIQDYTRNALHTEIRLAITGARISQLFPTVIPQFSARFPGVHITCLQGNQRFLEDQFRHNNIDMMMTADPVLLNDTTCITLLEETFFVLIPKKFMLVLFPDSTKYKEMLRHIRLNGISAILPGLSQFPFLMMNKGIRSRHVFEQFSVTHEFDFNIAIQSEDFSSILDLACQGLGICICSKTLLSSMYRRFTENDSPVEVLPLGPDAPPVNLRLFYKGDELSSPPALYLRDLIVEACAKIDLEARRPLPFETGRRRVGF